MKAKRLEKGKRGLERGTLRPDHKRCWERRLGSVCRKIEVKLWHLKHLDDEMRMLMEGLGS